MYVNVFMDVHVYVHVCKRICYSTTGKPPFVTAASESLVPSSATAAVTDSNQCPPSMLCVFVM